MKAHVRYINEHKNETQDIYKQCPCTSNTTKWWKYWYIYVKQQIYIMQKYIYKIWQNTSFIIHPAKFHSLLPYEWILFSTRTVHKHHIVCTSCTPPFSYNCQYQCTAHIQWFFQSRRILARWTVVKYIMAKHTQSVPRINWCRVVNYMGGNIQTSIYT